MIGSEQRSPGVSTRNCFLSEALATIKRNVQRMSVSYVYEIFCLAPDEASMPLADPDALKAFKSAREADLIFEAKDGDVFTLLEESAERLELPMLGLLGLNEFDRKFDSAEFGELWVKRIAASKLQGFGRDLARLVEIARSAPARLVFDHFRDPDMRTEFARDIALAASPMTVDRGTVLIGYDEGESLQHVFGVIQTLQRILASAEVGQKPLLCVWSCG